MQLSRAQFQAHPLTRVLSISALGGAGFALGLHGQVIVD